MDKLPTQGDLIANKYFVEGVLGSGGMGTVYEVSHRVTGKRFAIKWLLPMLAAQSEGVGRFMREAQVAGRVDHPNVVEVYDFGQDGDSFYIVMELLHGEPLSRRLERLGKLSVAAACHILIPIAHGLHAAHVAGVIHRDLKPDNIFLCRGPSGEEIPKVLDFGVSKLTNLTGEAGTHVTRAGVLIGTPRYMAPEQIRAEPVDARTDVYALGVILYEILSGEVPFPGDSYSDLVLRIMTEQPKPLNALVPGIPAAAVDVVSKAMSRDRSQRFANVMEFAAALEPFDKGTGLSSGAAPGSFARVAAALDLGLRDTTPMPTLNRGQSTGPEPESEPSPLRLRDSTPLSTESKRFDFGAVPGKRAVPRLVVVGLAVAAVAVTALGTVAYFSAGASSERANRRDVQKTAPPTGQATEDSVAAASAGPSGAAQPEHRSTTSTNPNSGDLPTPNTVRIGPDDPGHRDRSPRDEDTASPNQARADKLSPKPARPAAEHADKPAATVTRRTPDAPASPRAQGNRQTNSGAIGRTHAAAAALPAANPGPGPSTSAALLPPEPTAAPPVAAVAPADHAAEPPQAIVTPEPTAATEPDPTSPEGADQPAAKSGPRVYHRTVDDLSLDEF